MNVAPLLLPPTRNIVPNSVLFKRSDTDHFDRDHPTGALAGVANSSTGIVSLWVYLNSLPAAWPPFTSFALGVFNASMQNQITNTPRFTFFISSSGGTTQFHASTSPVAGRWYHVLASWSAGVATHLHINDVSDKTEISNPAGTYSWSTQTEWGVNANPSGGTPFDGRTAEVYFAPGQFLDFSVVANRRKFISASRKPVNLGSDGSTPTGSAPAVYLSLRANDAVSAFGTNRGTGGNFTMRNSPAIAVGP